MKLNWQNSRGTYVKAIVKIQAEKYFLIFIENNTYIGMWPKQNKPYPKKAINSYTENQKTEVPSDDLIHIFIGFQ